MSPVRIRRERTEGWRMPEGAIYVGRPTEWGNKFRRGDPFPRTDRQRDPSLNGLRMNWLDVVAIHRQWVQRHVLVVGDLDLEPLRGHDLACWCPLDEPCHADVLLELANRAVAA